MGLEQDIKRIADALEALAAHRTNGVVTTAAPAVTEPAADPLDPPIEKKRGRPVGTGADKPAPAAPPASTVKITEQELRDELRQFIVRHESKGKNKGMEAAADLLKKFNAKTVSTIKPEDFAAIVEHCKKDKAAYDAAAAKK